jgi:hypothetical protein
MFCWIIISTSSQSVTLNIHQQPGHVTIGPNIIQESDKELMCMTACCKVQIAQSCSTMQAGCLRSQAGQETQWVSHVANAIQALVPEIMSLKGWDRTTSSPPHIVAR